MSTPKPHTQTDNKNLVESTMGAILILERQYEALSPELRRDMVHRLCLSTRQLVDFHQIITKMSGFETPPDQAAAAFLEGRAD